MAKYFAPGDDFFGNYTLAATDLHPLPIIKNISSSPSPPPRLFREEPLEAEFFAEDFERTRTKASSTTEKEVHPYVKMHSHAEKSADTQGLGKARRDGEVKEDDGGRK